MPNRIQEGHGGPRGERPPRQVTVTEFGHILDNIRQFPKQNIAWVDDEPGMRIGFHLPRSNITIFISTGDILSTLESGAKDVFLRDRKSFVGMMAYTAWETSSHAGATSNSSADTTPAATKAAPNILYPPGASETQILESVGQDDLEKYAPTKKDRFDLL